MRIKSIHLRRFKRFSDLKIDNIPETAKLVIIAGPNGSGKSSLFEALHVWRNVYGRFGLDWDPQYHIKQPELGDIDYSNALQVFFMTHNRQVKQIGASRSTSVRRTGMILSFRSAP